jgi:hypothetical protein
VISVDERVAKGERQRGRDEKVENKLINMK